MATLEKKNNGKWQAKIRIKGYPHISKTFSSKKEAERWAAATEADIHRGVFCDTTKAQKTTLEEVILQFSSNYAPFHYRKRSDSQEAWKYQCEHLKKMLGKYALIAIDQQLVTKYRDERLKSVSSSTVRKELYMLSKILGYAQNELGITLPKDNPIKKIRKPSENKGRDRRLSAQEWTAFESACKKSKNPWLWPIVQFALETAMRQGEILALQWNDIDIERRFAMLKITKNGEARAVPLTTKALQILQELPRTISNNVFPIQRMTLAQAFSNARKRAGISDFHFHDLRHEALSRYAERGDLSIMELAAISGHKTLQMLKRYTHIQAEKLANKLG